ncbi:MAG: hypothetical protein KIT73_05095 [Burkholderiales bacterium]|nr:hypothetical protein [Burkholderiales bacterium]
MAKSEVRSSMTHGLSDQAPLPIGLPSSPGVGGRQASSPPPTVGGGYPDICTPSDFDFFPAAVEKIDPRLGELQAIGLHPAWLGVAKTIGVDAFLAAWRVLDASVRPSERGVLELQLRSYRSFLRYQRNRYIDALAAGGVPPTEIRSRVARDLGENLSDVTIRRVIKEGYRGRKK